jgi:hypothetical protein
MVATEVLAVVEAAEEIQLATVEMGQSYYIIRRKL